MRGNSCEMLAGRFHGWQPDGERNDSGPSTSTDVTPEADDIAAIETDGRFH
jgi:hypothetical protein